MVKKIKLVSSHDKYRNEMKEEIEIEFGDQIVDVEIEEFPSIQAIAIQERGDLVLYAISKIFYPIGARENYNNWTQRERDTYKILSDTFEQVKKDCNKYGISFLTFNPEDNSFVGGLREEGDNIKTRLKNKKSKNRNLEDLSVKEEKFPDFDDF